MLSQTIGERVRTLDVGEENVYLFEQISNSGPSFIVEIEGSRSESQWSDAVKKLQNTHPLMRVFVEHKRYEERPIFVNRNKPIEPSFDKWTSDLSIERELEKAFSKNFNHSTSDLFYFRIYQGANKTVIRGSYSHVVYDGFSGLIMLNDLLNFIADENYKREPHLVLAQNSEYLGAPTDWKYTSRPQIQMELSDFSKNPNSEEYRPQVRCAKFSKDITKALIDQAHAHNVTVHGILTGAFAQCVSKSQPFVVFHPVNLRPELKLSEAPGMVGLGGATSIDQVQGVSIFDIAKELKQKLADLRSTTTNKQMYTDFQSIISQMLTPQEAVQFFINGTPSITLSNYGAQKYIKSNYGDLKIESVFIGNILPTTIKFDVLNHQGDLCITTTARKPADVFEGLLPRVEELLRKELKL